MFGVPRVKVDLVDLVFLRLGFEHGLELVESVPFFGDDDGPLRCVEVRVVDGELAGHLVQGQRVGSGHLHGFRELHVLTRTFPDRGNDDVSMKAVRHDPMRLHRAGRHRSLLWGFRFL